MSNRIYTFAGHTVSSFLTLPALPTASETAVCADLRILIGDEIRPSDAEPEWRHQWFDSEENVTLSLAYRGDDAVLCFPDVAEITFTPDSTITVARAQDASDETLCHILIDQVLPRLLAHRGNLIVHGAALVMDDEHSIALVGETGYGKSTLSAAFAKSGARLLTDDCFLLKYDGARVQVDSHVSWAAMCSPIRSRRALWRRDPTNQPGRGLHEQAASC